MWCCLATLPLQKSLFFVFHHLFQKVKEHFSFYNTASVIFPPVKTHMYTQTTHPQMLKPRLDPWRQSLQLSQVSLITLFQDPVLYLENISVSRVAPHPHALSKGLGSWLSFHKHNPAESGVILWMKLQTSLTLLPRIWNKWRSKLLTATRRWVGFQSEGCASVPELGERKRRELTG